MSWRFDLYNKMGKENLLELANIINKNEEKFEDMLQAIGVNEDKIMKNCSEEELEDMLQDVNRNYSEEKIKNIFQAIGLDGDEILKNIEIYFLKKKGPEMLRAMGCDEDVIVDFNSSLDNGDFVKYLSNVAREKERKFREGFSCISEEGKCVICYNNFNMGFKCVRCKNIFHLGCIKIVIYKYGECPVCRAPCNF